MHKIKFKWQNIRTSSIQQTFAVLLNSPKMLLATAEKCPQSINLAIRMPSIRALSAHAQTHQQTHHQPSAAEQLEYMNAKPFSQIPGPSILELLRGFLPGGRFHNLQISEFSTVLRGQYGALVKLPGVFGKRPLLLTYNSANFETIFRTEGIWPIRRGLDAFEYYRKHIRPEVFKGRGGLVSDQGEEWGKMRMAVNPVMMQPKVARAYIKPVDSVAREFIEQIHQMRDVNDEMPDDFGTRLNEWSLESIGVIALDHRLGVMSKERNEEAESIIKAVKDFLRLGFKLEIEPSIWRYYKTTSFMQFMAALDVLTNTIMKYVEGGVKRHEEQKLAGLAVADSSVLDKLLEINTDYAVLMAFDMISAGIDTTSATSANFLYHMAKFQDVQKKLHDEIKLQLPAVDSPITVEILNRMPYFKACLKESMRMSPIVPGNVRGTGRNIVLEGYQVPANVDVAMGAILMYQDDSYFPRGKEFLPERWSRDDPETAELKNKNISPFVYLPFGFGPRTCIGKRFAELEIQILIMRILREFKVEWNYGPMEYAIGFVISPSSKLKFKFTNV